MKVLVLLSGGIDSTTCLALAIEKHGRENVEAISFNYGQKNIKELAHAKEICKFYHVNLIEMDISKLFSFSKKCAMLSHNNLQLSHQTYDKQFENLKENENVISNVPFRNGIMLSICAGYAIENNLSKIYYGIHREEGIAYDLYPDCSTEFNKSMNEAIIAGSGRKVEIEAPLCNLSKREIIKLAVDKNVPLDLTWTCYDNEELACGLCNSCTDRIKAFKELGLIDPIKYRR